MKAKERELPTVSPECWTELHAEIARLPEHYREPVVLYYLEGLTTEEALRTGCPQGTILSRLSRARQRLRRRLERRGVSFPASLLGVDAIPQPAALPATLLDSTVQAALAFVGRQTSDAALTSASATMAKGMLYAMTISKVKILGAMAMAGGIAWGCVQTFAQAGGQERVGAAPDAEEAGAALTRSVKKLQSELDGAARRNDEMRKELQAIDSGLKALRTSRQSSAANAAAALFAEGIKDDTSRAVSQLAEVLKRHPPPLSADVGFGYQAYMLDLVEGGITRIADAPLPDQICSGLPRWSHDGTRIVFDTTGAQWPLGRLIAIENVDGRPAYIDLGPGNHPTLSPDDRRIAFVLHPDADPGAEPGIWIMQADGLGRRRVGQFGAPFWSPDGHEFLINSYSLPTESTVINLDTKEGGVVKLAGDQIYSWPSWAGPGTLVSAIARNDQPWAIALLDVRKPSEARVIEILWERTKDLDVIPRWPVYWPDTRRCYFVGEVPQTKRTVYQVERGESRVAKPLEVVEHQRNMRNQQLGGLSFSPDGRYLVFNANRPEPR